MSQSQLKGVLQNNKKDFKDTIPLILGSCVDTILTTQGLEKDLYHIGLAKRPSDSVKEIVDKVWNNLVIHDVEFEDYKSALIAQARDSNYQVNYGNDALWNAIKKDGEAYWNELKDASDKKVITQDEWNFSCDVASRTLSSSITGMYFTEQKNVDKFFQLPLYWTYELNGETIECKGLVDELVVDYENKLVVLIDIKCTDVNNIQMFLRVCKDKGYPFQLSWYKEGLLQHPEIGKVLAEGYRLEFRWMVLPLNTYVFKPWVLPVSDELIMLGKYGYSKSHVFQIETKQEHNMVYRSGWLEALTIYQESINYGTVDYDLEWFKTQGRMDKERVNQLFFT